MHVLAFSRAPYTGIPGPGFVRASQSPSQRHGSHHPRFINEGTRQASDPFLSETLTEDPLAARPHAGRHSSDQPLATTPALVGFAW